jgi:NADH:ubiquinone oxidoreductase subunit 6 (subunit J)
MPEVHTLFFYVIAILTGLCAIGVVVTQNIVRSAAWLLFTLCGVAGLFFLLGADFVGATQLIVYVGGTLVLVVFGVMLTAQGPFINLRISAAEWGASLVVGLLLFGVLAVTTWTAFSEPASRSHREPAAALTNPTTSDNTVLIGHGLLGQTVGPGQATGYLLPFEIVSVHLLVVLIGAAYLARAKRRRGPDHA